MLLKPKQFLKTLDKKNPPNLILFYGIETAYMDKVLNNLRDKILGETWEFNWSVLEGKNTSLEKLEEALTASPFAAEWRIVVLKNAMAFWKTWPGKERERVIQLFSHIPHHTVLILTHPGELEEKKGKNPLLELINKGNHPTVQFTPQEEDLKRWAKKTLKKEGIQADDERIGWLIEAAEGRMDLLDQELEKILLAGDIEMEREEKAPNYRQVSSMVYRGNPALLEFMEDLMAIRGHIYLFRVLASSVMRIVATKIAMEEGIPMEEVLKDIPPHDGKLIKKRIQHLPIKKTLSMLDATLETEVSLKAGPLPHDKALMKFVNQILKARVN